MHAIRQGPKRLVVSGTVSVTIGIRTNSAKNPIPLAVESVRHVAFSAAVAFFLTGDLVERATIERRTFCRSGEAHNQQATRMTMRIRARLADKWNS